MREFKFITLVIFTLGFFVGVSVHKKQLGQALELTKEKLDKEIRK